MARFGRPPCARAAGAICSAAMLGPIAALLLVVDTVPLPNRIVLPSDAIPAERAAAELLVREIRALTGAEVRIERRGN